MNQAKRVDYAEVLKARAKRYHDATATPDHKPLDRTQLRNKKNIARWREQFLKQVLKEDTQ